MNKWLQIMCTMALAVVLVSGLLAEVTVQLTSPEDGAYVTPCTELVIHAEVTATAPDTIKDVRFYYNDRQKYRDRREPWEYKWKSINRGVYNFYAKVTTLDGTEYFSNSARVKVGPVSMGEKIYNGSFDCGKFSGWNNQIQGGAAATFEIYDDFYFDDQYYMYVEITNGGGEVWHVQSITTCPTDSGHVYEISFLADAIDPKAIDVSMQENQDPWAVQMNLTIDIDGPDLYGPFEFIATKTDPTNQLRFNIGLNTIAFFLDDVQVIDRSASAVKAKRLDWRGGLTTTYELQQAYPNPFNMSTSLRYFTAKAANIEIELFDVRGRKVRSLYSGMAEPGSHVARWDGRDDFGKVLSSGVYLARMTVQDKAIPVVMSRKLLLVK